MNSLNGWVDALGKEGEKRGRVRKRDGGRERGIDG
jgi:hypothetical protein